MHKLPYAEECSYWKTGKSGVETWMERTEKLIEDVGGSIHQRIIGRVGNNEGILLEFAIGLDVFKAIFPVLPTKKPADRMSALRQAATFLYHDTKARVNRITIFGPRIAFLDYLLTPGGKTVAELADQDAADMVNGLKLLN